MGGSHVFTIVATPNPATSQYVYVFSGWNHNCNVWAQSFPGWCTMEAQFDRIVNEYIVTFDSN
jgi:hypothetical protein